MLVDFDLFALVLLSVGSNSSSFLPAGLVQPLFVFLLDYKQNRPSFCEKAVLFVLFNFSCRSF